MSLPAMFVVLLIALVHLYILWFEMFKWESRGPRVFTNLSKDLFKPTKAMAGNQGLYNGFLAAGLLWSLLINDEQWQHNVALCFLLFVLVAGCYGAATVSKKIAYVQAVPALVGIVCLYLT